MLTDTEMLAAFLTIHRLVSVECNEQGQEWPSDRPICACGTDLGKYPIVGIAHYAWARHVAVAWAKANREGDPELEATAQRIRGETPDGTPIR